MTATVDEYGPGGRPKSRRIVRYDPSVGGDKEYLDVKRLLRTLKREKRLVLGPALLAVGLVFTYFAFAAPQYTASAQVLIDIQKPNIIAGKALVPGLDTSRNMIGPVIDSEVEILRSPQLAARVIRSLGLDKSSDALRGPSLRHRITGVAMSAYQFVRRQFGLPVHRSVQISKNDKPGLPVTLIERFLRKLSVRRQGLTLILSVRYSDTNPLRAAQIANAIVAAYLDGQRQSKFNAAVEAGARLQERVTQLRKSARLARQRIQDYAKANNLVSIDGLTISEREITATLADLVSARGVAAGNLAELQRVKRLAKHREQFGSIERVLKSNVIRGLRDQQAQVERQLATLISQFGEHHFEVEQKRAELAGIRNEIDKEAQRIIRSIHHDYEVSVGRVKLTERRLHDLESKYTKRKQLTIHLLELQQESQATNQIYKTLLARMKETNAQLSLLLPDARLISSASPPQRQSAPKKTMLLVLVLAGGLGLGVTLALLRDHMRDVLRDGDDVEAVAGFKNIASIPALPPDVDPMHVVRHDTASQVSQEIFMIKHAILGDNPHDLSKIIAIASPNDGEGKSMLAANLAQYMASTGALTLLIDCDLRTANLTRRLLPHSSHPAHSIVDILNGESEADDVIVQLEDSDVYFCPGPYGSALANPMELLAPSEIKDFLSQRAEEYEVVIVDTSAMIPVVDARALIDSVDAVILVIEQMRTTAADLQRLARLVPELINKVVGTVTNKPRIGQPDKMCSLIADANELIAKAVAIVTKNMRVRF